MIRALSALLLWLALALPALAQNVTCPDVPAGDSSNRCANTRFVLQNGGGAPGGTSGQLQYNNAGAFGGFTLNGDCTIAVPAAGTIVCTKTNGVAFAPIATVATAPNLSYTAPGTGGVLQTAASKFQQEINAADYGAVCNGVVNNDTPFANATLEAIALSQTLVLPGGNCKLNSQWVLPMGLKIRGQGTFNTTITCAANIVCMIGIGAVPPAASIGIQITDLSVTAPGGSTGVLIQFGDNTHALNYPVIRNVLFGTCGTCLVLDNVGVAYITNNWFNGGYSGAAIQIAAPLNVDGGDALIDGNWFIGTTTSIAIQHVSGGGWKISNNKMVTNQYAYFMNATLGGLTLSSLIISNNSMEGCVQACMAFANTSAVSGQLLNVAISGNQGGAASGGYFIIFGTNARSWVRNATVTGNTGLNVSGNSCIFMDSIATFTVTGNTCDDVGAPSGFAIVIGSLATVGGVTGNQFGGGFTSPKRYTVIAGADVRIIDVNGVALADIPANANVGSMFICTNCNTATSPCTGGGAGASAFRLPGGLKCF